MSFVNRLWVKIFSKQIGVDQFGNKYFIGRGKTSLGQNKRYVVYHGIADGSKVPPMWHAWLHYSSDEVPLGANKLPYSWQKEHIQNLTGSKHAYNPQESNSFKLKIYSKWNPNEMSIR